MPRHGRSFRSYEIVRDDDGKPTQMIWRGDFVRASVTYTTCPKCASQRMQDNRCLDCWHDARNEFWRNAADAKSEKPRPPLRQPDAR
jgi:hypothetical protein